MDDILDSFEPRASSSNAIDDSVVNTVSDGLIPVDIEGITMNLSAAELSLLKPLDIKTVDQFISRFRSWSRITYDTHLERGGTVILTLSTDRPVYQIHYRRPGVTRWLDPDVWKYGIYTLDIEETLVSGKVVFMLKQEDVEFADLIYPVVEVDITTQLEELTRILGSVKRMKLKASIGLV